MLNGIKFKANFGSNQSTETNDPPKGRNLPHDCSICLPIEFSGSFDEGGRCYLQ